jgi:hypothetical protein
VLVLRRVERLIPCYATASGSTSAHAHGPYARPTTEMLLPVSGLRGRARLILLEKVQMTERTTIRELTLYQGTSE